MPTPVDTVLSEALIERGYLKRETLDPLVMKAAESSGGLASFLIKRGMVSEEIVLTVLAERFNIPRVDLGKVQMDKGILEKIPLKFAEYYRFFPVKLDNKKLTVAVSLPLDIRTQDEIRTHLGFAIQMMLARENDINEAVKKWYGLGAGTIEKIMQTNTGKETPAAQAAPEHEKVEDIEKLAEEASVIQLVNQILVDAFKKRATDIHFEPYREKIKIRYRIDGILYDTPVPPEIKKFFLPIVSRVKIMGNLNIIERRLPQDGRAIVKVFGETLDLRISCIPTPYGESVVLRLLPLTRIFSLELLGLEEWEAGIFKNLIEKPHGIVFITGPTGSGKSTTLYASLSRINTVDRKIITLEDPVEHEIEGITQIQVMPSVGLDFARGLRSILRHDPDVIMVGEVRDLETAEIAARVALTGHLVFSSLHTNDAASGITRLIDMGVESYLISSSVEAFIAQRLVRTICTECKVEDTSQPDELKTQIAKELGLNSKKDVTIYKGKGCEKCNSQGYWGRVAIFEILIVDETIRELVMKRVPAGEIKKVAIAKGMRTLRQSGWRKVVGGFTTSEEVLEVAPEEITLPASVSILEGGAVKEKEGSTKTAAEKEAWAGRRSSEADKRLFLRLNVKVNIRYRLIKSQEAVKKNINAEQLSIAKNISAGGLLFVASEAVPLGAILELKIELPDGKQPVECLSRVVRVSELESEKKYDTAVCFLDLAGADRTRLNKFVEEEAS